MSGKFKRVLERIVGGKGGISEQRLEEWLLKNCGHPIRLDDGRVYQFFRGPDDDQGRKTFGLMEVK